MRAQEHPLQLVLWELSTELEGQGLSWGSSVHASPSRAFCSMLGSSLPASFISPPLPQHLCLEQLRPTSLLGQASFIHLQPRGGSSPSAGLGGFGRWVLQRVWGPQPLRRVWGPAAPCRGFIFRAFTHGAPAGAERGGGILSAKTCVPVLRAPLGGREAAPP